MKAAEFPLVMSPNLGCPRIVTLEGIKKGETIPLVVAGRYGEFTSPLRDAFQATLYLRPSSGQDEDSIFTFRDLLLQYFITIRSQKGRYFFPD